MAGLVKTVWRRRPEKPLQIEVVVLTADNVREVAEWCGGQYRIEGDPQHPERTDVSVFLPIGDKVARTGSCVCRDDEGRFFTVRREEIIQHFDPVTFPPPTDEQAAGGTEGLLDYLRTTAEATRIPKES